MNKKSKTKYSKISIECSLQIGDCSSNTYLWNDHDLIIYNGGDVSSIVLLRINKN